MTRAFFLACLAVGRLLRSTRYSKVRIVNQDGECEVRKHRVLFAPLLIWLSRPLLRLLDAGVRVHPRRQWVERERQLYQRLYGKSTRIDGDGTLILPCLAGETLAALLEDARLEEPVRNRAMELAVAALAAFHRLGFTHGDAMAENVLIDLDAKAAHWFDFETVHDENRPMDWRRADDVRALLATCVLRTRTGRVSDTVDLILDAYADEGVDRLLAASFASVLRRPLIFHLAQAGLSFQCYREMADHLSPSTTNRSPRRRM